ncbi:penicillin-binding protein 1C [Pseudolabrys taiwanensis]|uniref:peptidoglycan glycosyltransferase n=1 Tax=Pseudolabrys taiwanensis TaxID=331696 RepID=A0A345ZS97_9HYPH|nr:penicillin-binding protein 1C [Pseudolabrys taiwanensis]AXK79794.1 penicillin-binding protein 1C [Pseudolabrys taiwanensis]
MKRYRTYLISLGGALMASALALGLWVWSLGPAPLGNDLALSHIVVDRDGKLLRAYATPDGRWRLPATPDDVDPRLIKVLLGYEDRRFYEHDGVDLYALVRAAFQLITKGHIVSGGSTLSMQVARLLEPREKRSFSAKARQIVRALELEWHLSKRDVLSLYLTLAPYGGNLEGIRAASLAYFSKEPKRLTLSESGLLVALPQAPERRRPDRHPEAAQAARDGVLDRVAAQGLIPPDEVLRAKAGPVPTERKQLPTLAPHAADSVLLAEPDVRVHRLTIDATLQKSLEDLARERARALGPEISVAILAVDNATGQVLAHVGSADYFDARRAGQVDMTQALRSPGSTLKPFIYGLGFEDGLIHPETLIDDQPQRYGNYVPENFDLTFQGTVSIRKALQLSLNGPAIAVLGRVGINRLSARLTQTGAALVLPKGEAPGLAMGLGGVGVKLADLTMLYVGLARLGEVVPLTERAGAAAASPGRLLAPAAAWYVTNVLLGAPPPENAPFGRLAFKTGTSYGYRDAWSVGLDGRMTIGVWVGRPDGNPVPGIIGRVTAAPILFDAFARAGHTPVSLPKPPKGVMFATNAKLPPPLQKFSPAGSPGQAVEAPRIMFPPDGARLELSALGAPDPVALKIAGGRTPLTVMVNGVPLAPPGARRTLFFRPDGPGFVRLTVMDARGATDSVTVRLQ